MMLADAFLNVIRKRYPLFNLEMKLRGRTCFCEVSEMRQIAEEMLDWFLVYPYHYELPSEKEDYNAHIGKETRNTILVYKKITNIYGLPTYNKVRIVFELPKDLPEEKVSRFLWKVDRTFADLYRIKKTLDDFMKKLLPSEWRWDNDLEKLMDVIIQRKFNEASIIYENITHQKQGVEIPGGFIPLPSCLFKIPEITLNTTTSEPFIAGLLVQIFDNLEYQRSKTLIDFFFFREEKHF